MMANAILVSVIGIFFAAIGVMYIFHLKQQEVIKRNEKIISYSILLLGVALSISPLFTKLILSDHSNRQKSVLLGEENFGPPPPVVSGNYEEAAAFYEKGVKLWKSELNGYDSSEKAMEYFNQSIKIYETAEALTARGQLKVQISKMKSALPDYNRAIELKADFGNAYFNRAALFYIFNDISAACADWSKAAELGVPGAGDLVMSNCN